MLYEFNRQITKLLTKSGLRDKSSFYDSIPWLKTQIRFPSWWQTYVHTYLFTFSWFQFYIFVFLRLKDKVRSIDISLDLSTALSLGDLDNFTMCALRGIVKEQWSVHAGIQILTVRQAPTLFQIFYPHPSHFILFTDFLPCLPSSIQFHPIHWFSSLFTPIHPFSSLKLTRLCTPSGFSSPLDTLTARIFEFVEVSSISDAWVGVGTLSSTMSLISDVELIFTLFSTVLDSIAASLFVLNWLSWQIVSVSDDKIQITILILRRGALSKPNNQICEIMKLGAMEHMNRLFAQCTSATIISKRILVIMLL